MKNYTVAGYSTSPVDGRKMRFANHVNRARVLHYAGDTEIQLFKLPVPMTKPEAEAWLAYGETTNFEGCDLIVYVPRAEKAPVAAQEAPSLTFEEALAQVPVREKGRFIKKEVREQMARDLMAK